MATKRVLILPPNRMFCSPSKPEKCYVIKTRDAGNKVLYENEILKNFREQQQKDPKVKVPTLRERMIEISKEFFKKGEDVMVVVRRLKLDKKFRQVQEAQAANFKVLNEKYQLETLPGRIKERLEVATGNEGFKKVSGVSNSIIEFSKASFDKALIYWRIFLKSEARKTMEKFIILLWINGRLASMRILKFIREAYFNKSGTKAVRKH